MKKLGYRKEQLRVSIEPETAKKLDEMEKQTHRSRQNLIEYAIRRIYPELIKE